MYTSINWKNCVTDIVTERCYLQVTPEGLVLKELAPGYTVEDIIAAIWCRNYCSRWNKELWNNIKKLHPLS